MQTVILAAGIGSRMKELTANTPKPLLRIGEQTLLEHKFHHLPDEIDEVIIVIGYLGDQIKERFGNEHGGRKITYVFQEEMNGTGAALALCKDKLKDKFLVLMGDDLYAKEDLMEMLKYDRALLAWELPEDMAELRMGDVKIDEKGRMIGIEENCSARKGMLMNAAAYVLKKDFFDYPLQPKSPGSTEFGLPQTLILLAKDGKDIHIVKTTWWKNVTCPEDLSYVSSRK